MQNGEGLRSSEYIGSFTAKTDGTKALMMQNWKDNNYLKNIFVVKKFPTQETLSIFVV